MGGLPWDLLFSAISLGVLIQALMSSEESLLPTPSSGFLEFPLPATEWHIVHFGEADSKIVLPFSPDPSCGKVSAVAANTTTMPAAAHRFLVMRFPPRKKVCSCEQ